MRLGYSRGIGLEDTDRRQVGLWQPKASVAEGQLPLPAGNGDQAVQGDGPDRLRLDAGAPESIGQPGPDPVGGRRSFRRQGVEGDMADVAVPDRLSPGKAVPDLQDIKPLSEEQLVPLLGAGVGLAANRRCRDCDLHPPRAHIASGGHQALQAGGGEVAPRRGQARVGPHP